MASVNDLSSELPDDQIQSYLAFAEQAVREVGKGIARRFSNRSFTVTDKSDGSPVTEADREAEELLRRRIGDEFPEHGVLGEEFGGSGLESEKEFVWVIDPIDGTKSFIHGVPLFGTLLGLLYQNRPVIGLIYQPVLGMLVTGDNKSTQFNGARIRVREPRPLSRATLLLTDPSDPWLLAQGENYTALLGHASVVRSWGDCFGYLSLVTGLADAMIDPVLNPWDFLPLLPILRGSGATFSDREGKAVEEGHSVVAASCPALHEEIMKYLR